MYYDYHKIISYDAFFNFLIGERRRSVKPTGATKLVINNFIKKKEQFVVIRRYKSELTETMSTFFDSMIKNNEFPDHEFKTDGNKFYIDGKVAGHGIVLSTSQNLKGSNFDMVKTVIFDEYAIEPGQKKYYLQNDVVIFLNLIETIARMRDIRVFLLGNPADIYTNPYFAYFNLSMPYNTDIKLFKNNLILVQYMFNPEYREAKKQTKFGQIVQGTSFRTICNRKQAALRKQNIYRKEIKVFKVHFCFYI